MICRYCHSNTTNTVDQFCCCFSPLRNWSKSYYIWALILQSRSRVFYSHIYESRSYSGRIVNKVAKTCHSNGQERLRSIRPVMAHAADYRHKLHILTVVKVNKKSFLRFIVCIIRLYSLLAALLCLTFTHSPFWWLCIHDRNRFELELHNTRCARVGICHEYDIIHSAIFISGANSFAAAIRFICVLVGFVFLGFAMNCGNWRDSIWFLVSRIKRYCTEAIRSIDARMVT